MFYENMLDHRCFASKVHILLTSDVLLLSFGISSAFTIHHR